MKVLNDNNFIYDDFGNVVKVDLINWVFFFLNYWFVSLMVMGFIILRKKKVSLKISGCVFLSFFCDRVKKF